MLVGLISVFVFKLYLKQLLGVQLLPVGSASVDLLTSMLTQRELIII